MSDKLPCKECGAMVLPTTAEKTGGLCMPCKNGIRKNIEASKEHRNRESELDKNCPYRALWRDLVEKVYKREGGFDALNEFEKTYFSVTCLNGEIFNGGFDQYFHNSSGDHYRYAELGLVQLDATESLKILRLAKERLFGSSLVPKSQELRWNLLRARSKETRLDDLDTKFCEIQEGLSRRLENYAIEAGLVKNA